MKNKNGIRVAGNKSVAKKKFVKKDTTWRPESNPFNKYAEIEINDGENVASIILPYTWENIKQYLAEGWVLKGSWSK